MTSVNVLLLGHSGFFGTNFQKEFTQEFKEKQIEDNEVTLYTISRINSKESNIRVFRHDGKLCSASKESRFDFIINAVAKRSGNPPIPDRLVKESCLDYPASIISRLANKETTVINLSTYIQNKEGIRGKTTEPYAFYKNQLSEKLDIDSKLGKHKLIDLYIFTLYGPGDHPNRLIPKILQSAREEFKLEMTPGRQLLNLLHVSDLSKEILALIRKGNVIRNSKFEMWDPNHTFELREWVARIEKTLNRDVKCEWGSLDYNGHEMMTHWPRVFAQFPFMNPRTEFEKGILSLWRD